MAEDYIPNPWEGAQFKYNGVAENSLATPYATTGVAGGPPDDGIQDPYLGSGWARGISRDINPTKPSPLMYTLGTPTLAAASFLNSTLSSLHIISSDTLNNTLQRVSPEMYNYYQVNKGGIDLAGEGAGLFLPGMLAVKILRSTTRVGAALDAIPYLRGLVLNEGKLASLQETLQMERIGAAVSEGSVVKPTWLNSAATKDYYIASLLHGAKQSAIFEAATLATNNSNTLYFPEENSFTDNLLTAGAFAVGGTVLSVGAEFVAARRIVAEAGRQADKYASFALNPFNLNKTDLIARPGFYDQAITKASIDSAASQTAIDSVAPGQHVGQVSRLNTAVQVNEGLIFGSGQKPGYITRMGQEAFGDEMAPAFTPTAQELDNMRMGLKNDPLAFLAVKGLARYRYGDDTIASFLKAQEDHVESLTKRADELIAQANKPKTGNKQALLDESDRLRGLAKEMGEMQPFVMRDGVYTPLRADIPKFRDDPAYMQFVHYDPADIERGYTVKGVQDPRARAELNFRVAADFLYTDPTIRAAQQGGNLLSEHWVRMSPFKRDAVFTAYGKMLDYATKQKGLMYDASRGGFPMPVTPKRSWIELEAIDEGIARGAIKESDLQFSKDYTLNDMRADIVAKKYKDFLAFQKLRDPTNLTPVGQEISDAQMRHALNMPINANGELSPLETFFNGLAMQGEKDISGMAFSQIVEQLKAARNLPPGLEFIGQSEAALGRDNFAKLLRGQAFGVPGAKETSPVLVWRANTTPFSFSRDAVDGDMATRRASVQGILGSDFRDPGTGATLRAQDSLVAQTRATIASHPAYEQSRLVDTIGESSARSQGGLVFQRFATRDSPVFNALHDIAAAVGKFAVETQRKFMASPIVGAKSSVDILRALQRTENEASLIHMTNYMQARSQGWFLLPKESKVNDLYGFVLDHNNQFNQEKYAKLYGQELQQGTLMPAAHSDEYKPLLIDENAFEGAQMFANHGKRLLANQNQILTAMGETPINFREWWAPPRVFTDKKVAYLMDMSQGGKVRRMLIGNTAHDLEQQKQDADVLEYIAKNNLRIMDPQEIERYHLARDRAFYELLDAGDPLVKRGAAAAGSSASPYTPPGIQWLTESMQSIERQVNNITRDTTGLMYEGEIAYASRADAMHAFAVPPKQASIWQRYEDVILGNRAIRRNYYMSKFNNLVETAYDGALQAIWNATGGKTVSQIVTEGVNRKLGRTEAQFARLQQSMGDHLPFETAAEYAASRFNIRPPDTARKQMAAVNRLATTVTLRFLDMAQPLLNISGVLNTMPAVIRSLAKAPGEDHGEWLSRIGGIGTMFPTQEPLGVLDSTKLMIRAMYYGWTKYGQRHLKYAIDHGMLRQPVNDMNELLANPYTGDSFIRKIAESADKYTGIMADKSEEVARGWAHMAGVLLAQKNFMQTDEGIHAFANKFADLVIGDYRPANKPAIFQGVAGMPLGLFQTYTWNWWQRMFGYIERREYRTAAIQTAMQGALYGGVTIPGFHQFNLLFNNIADGRNNPIDSLQQRLGSSLSDLVLYGTLGSIPKIFTNDGIALYTRGDVTPRVPAFLDPSNMPMYTLANNTMQLIGKTLDAFRSANGLTSQQMFELMGQYSSNRFLGRMFELAAGYSTDRRGNVIANDINNGLSYVARLMAMRPLNESKAIQASQMQKFTELSQYDKRLRLTESLKSAFRGGTLDGDLLGRAFLQYVQTGGSPAYFPQYLRATALNALTPKSQLKLQELMKNNMHMQDAIRMANSILPDE